MRKYYLILMILGSVLMNAQILYRYPKNQEFYKGGRDKFYEELKAILKTKNYKVCDKDEALMVKVLVTSEGKVQFVAEEDTEAVAQNKCATEMIKSALAHLENWQPAEVNGKKVNAIARFSFIPNDKLNDVLYSKEDFKPSSLAYEIDKFRKFYYSCFNADKFRWEEKFKINLYFEVNTQGKPQFLHIDPAVENTEFMNMLSKCIFRSKNKWEPASYKGMKLVTSFKFPLAFSD